MEEFKITARDGIAFLLGLVGGAYGARKIPEYIEKLEERRAKSTARYLVEGLNETGMLGYAEKIDGVKIYKALENLTTRMDGLEKKVDSLKKS